MSPVERQISVLLALYDSASRSSAQRYWVWRHSALTDLVLDALYYDVVAPRLYAEPRPTSAFTTIDDEWCCWYRLQVGGRDSLGRPGRFLIAAALMRRSDVIEVDTTSVLELPFFQEVALAAEQSSSTTSLAETEEIFHADVVPVDAQTLEQLRWGSVVEFHEQDGLRAVVIACSSLTPPARWRLDIRSDAKGNQVEGEASIIVVPKKPKLPPTTAGNTSADGGLSSPERSQQRPGRNIRLLGAIALFAVAIGAAGSIYWLSVLRSPPGAIVKPHGPIDEKAVNSQPHQLDQPFGRERDGDSAQRPGVLKTPPSPSRPRAPES